MRGWESEGKGRGCVAKILYKKGEGREEARKEADEGSCHCFAGRYSVKRVYFS